MRWWCLLGFRISMLIFSSVAQPSPARWGRGQQGCGKLLLSGNLELFSGTSVEWLWPGRNNIECIRNLKKKKKIPSGGLIKLVWVVFIASRNRFHACTCSGVLPCWTSIISRNINLIPLFLFLCKCKLYTYNKVLNSLKTQEIKKRQSIAVLSKVSHAFSSFFLLWKTEQSLNCFQKTKKKHYWAVFS